MQEYFLGYFNVEIDESGIFSALGNLPETPEDIPMKKIDGVMTPYYAMDMKNGTPCGLMVKYIRILPLQNYYNFTILMLFLISFNTGWGKEKN